MIDRRWPAEWEIVDSQKGDFKREWSCFDFSTCEHKISSIIFNNNWELEICDECSKIINKECLHRCVWNSTNTMFRCEYCGVDAT